MANATYEVKASQFNIDHTYPGRWTITFNNPPINMFVPSTIVELGALITDLDADTSVKVVVFQWANPDFFHRPSRRSQGS
jgi:enoyl-CoA hydratase/carnithine racemase